MIKSSCPALAIVDARRLIAANLVPMIGLKLLSHFDVWTLAKGGDYYRAGKVRYVSVASGGQIQASVTGSGSNSYSVMLLLSTDLSSIRSARCSCPVGSNCKHCVAVTRAYLDRLPGNNADGRVDLSKYDQLIPQFSSTSTRGVIPLVDGATGGALDVGNGTNVERVASGGLLSDGNGADQLTAGGANIDGLKDSSNKDSSNSTKLNLTSPESHELSRRFEMLQHTLKGTDIISREAASEFAGEKARNAIVYVIYDSALNTEPGLEARKVIVQNDGSYGGEVALRVEKLLDYATPKYMSDLDEEIIKLWISVANYGVMSHAMRAGFGSDADLFSLLIHRILQSGKCFFETSKSTALKLGPSLPARLRWRDVGDNRRLELVGFDQLAEHVCLRWKFPWYFNEATNELGMLLHDFSESALSAIWSVPPIPKSDLVSATVIFHNTGFDHIIPPPADDQVEVRRVAPGRSLRLRRLVSESEANLHGKALASPGQTLRVVAIKVTDPADLGVQVTSDGRIILTKVDEGASVPTIAFERAGFIEAPFHLFRGSDESERYFVAREPRKWMELHALAEKLRGDGWNIEADTLEELQPIELDENNLEISVEDDGNFWFSLSLNLDVDGQQVPLLPVLLSALKSLPQSNKIDAEAIDSLNRNGKFVTPLLDGKVVSFPFERIRAILLSFQEMLLRDGSVKKLKTSLSQAEAMFQPGNLKNARWLNADKMHGLVDRLRVIQNIAPLEAPEGFLTTLRPYQMEGLGWLQALSQQDFGGILADDMGLGKTVQLLAHICLEKQLKRLEKPFLIICPTSVAPNWMAEAKRFAPGLKLLNYTGANRLERFSEISGADLVVTTYPLLSRDFEELHKLQWHGIALDEAQVIKNPDSQIALHVTELKSEHRFCLTGTPIQNNLGELWSHFRFLAPGLLGEQSTFNKWLRHPIEKFGDAERQKILNSRIRPFILRRTKAEVASELPEKTIIVEPVILSGPQLDLYEAVRLAATQKIQDEIAKKGFKRSQIVILDALLKLRQVCCDPRLVKISAAKDVVKSAKLELLVEKLIELSEESRRVLVFSQFTSMLDLVAEELDKNHIQYVQLRGDTRDRITPVETFQKGSVPVFLISLKAGGTGLNLTAADTVIHYDPWWNPAAEDQATDRAHRIGQAKHVFVYKLIAQGTIEEKMLDLQERKRELANSIFDATGNLGVGFNELDLQDLLRPIDQ